MSVCSSEVCSLSEKKSAVKEMATLTEDPNRASPVPFSNGKTVNEAFSSDDQETLKQSENVQQLEEGNVHITQKTKVEDSFVRSQKMYTAEVSKSQSSTQVRASSPEMEQIMAKRQIYQSYQDSARLTPNTLSVQQKAAQSERCLTPEIEHLMEKPHGSWSPMPAACFVRPISPSHIVSFPPDIPPIPATLPQPRTATPEQFQDARETVERFVDHTKQVHHTHSNRSTQQATHYVYNQHFTGQQYTPRYDNSQGFAAYVGRGNSVDSRSANLGNQNGNPGNNGARNPQNPGNSGGRDTESISSGNPGYSGYTGKDNSGHGNGKSGNKKNENGGIENNSPDKDNQPTVTEPDDDEGKYSRKSFRADQSQKSSRKTSASEEETIRRVFSDFGGPQISSSVEVESTTEGGVQKTSVKKSQKMEYSTCEFESSRKSTIVHDGDQASSLQPSGSNAAKGSKNTAEQRKYSYPKFKASDNSTGEEEMVTKSQVEEIIKQELNKVFQMAQTMETTNFGEMYSQKSQSTKSEQCYKENMEQSSVQVAEQYSSQTLEQKKTSSNKTPVTGEIVTKTGKLTSGLTIAPDRPFTPQALETNYPLSYQNVPSDFPPPRQYPEPPKGKLAYVPVTGDRSSPFIQALTIASDRPYSPLPTATVIETPTLTTPPKPKQSSMVDALTTAPSTPFQIQSVSLKVTEDKAGQRKTECKYESAQKLTETEFKPIPAGQVEPKPPTSYISTTHTVETCNITSFPPVTDELKSAFKSTSQVQTSTFAESERQHVESSKQTVKTSQQRSSSVSRTEGSSISSGLHPPNLLPYYQQHIGEIPLAHRSNSPVPHQIRAPSTTPPRAQSVPRQGERRSSVKALGEAYLQQLAAQNSQQTAGSGSGASSISYVSTGAYSSGAVTKAYSYEQEHKSINAMGYHASPLAGKLPLAGEQNLPKCSSPVLGKLDHTKQVFKPSVTPQQLSSTVRSTTAEQANLRQAPPFFVRDTKCSQATFIKEKDDEEIVNISFKLPQSAPSISSFSKSTKPSLPTFPLKPSLLIPNVNKTLPAFPGPSKPFSVPGVTKPPSELPDAGPGGAPKGGTTAGTTAPRRGRGVLNTAVAAGARVPLCGSCNSQIRGPFITALGKIWCPDHFVCVNAQCRRQLQDIGFVEDPRGLYCEYCFEQYLAPTCNKCNAKVKGDCLNAIGKHFHPECFTCAYCGKLFGNNPFFLEDALPYCEADWNELFTTKCFSCGFPIEAGDRWVEALNNNYHSQCFNCTMCKKNLEGQSFFAKGGRPFCKNHAR